MKRILIAMALVAALVTVGGQSVLAATAPSKVSGKLVTTTTGATTTGATTMPGVILTTSPTGSSKYTKYCPKDGGKDGRCPAPVTLPPQQILVTPPVGPGIQPPQQQCTATTCFFTVVGFPPSTPVDIMITGGPFPVPVTIASTTTDVNGTAPVQLILDDLCGMPGGPFTYTITVSTTSGTPTTTTATVTC